MRNLFILFSLMLSPWVLAQNLVSELNGFKLGQFREVTLSELDEPISEDEEGDGFEYELFLLKPDSSAYMIFEYPEWNRQQIWSIQLYGPDLNEHPIFENLKMGSNKEKLISLLGEPTEVIDQNEYGKLLMYDKSNYSFEFNTNDRLSSIKIINNYNEFYPNNNLELVPKLDELKKSLLSQNNEEIADLLSPALAIHNDEEAFFFQYSWKSEIEEDKSGIFDIIKKKAQSLKDINLKKDQNVYWELRISETEVPLQVLKFPESADIKEIVFKWELGKYLIWEIEI